MEVRELRKHSVKWLLKGGLSSRPPADRWHTTVTSVGKRALRPHPAKSASLKSEYQRFTCSNVAQTTCFSYFSKGDSGT